MKIVCDACSAKYSIADEKVRGKVFKIRCKKCSNIIVVRGASPGAEGQPAPQQSFDQKETKVFDYSGYDDPAAAAEAAAQQEAAASASDAVWHLVIDQEQVGPMTVAEVHDRFARGEVDIESYVWREGFADWEPLGSVDAFRDLESMAPPAAHDDAAAGMFGGPEIADSATARSDPADLFAAASGEADDVGSELFGGGGLGDDVGGVVASTPGLGAEESMADSLFGGGGVGGAAAEEEGDEGPVQLKGQRNENSVLFSLSNLAALASPEAKAAAAVPSAAPSSLSSSGGGLPQPGMAQAGGSEGSGLIDIRSMAGAYFGSKGEAAPGTAAKETGSADDLPTFSQTSFDQPSAVLLPGGVAAASTNNRLLYALLAVIGVLVIAAVVLVIVVVKGGKKETTVAANNSAALGEQTPGAGGPGTPPGTEPGTPEKAGAAAAGESDEKPSDSEGSAEADTEDEGSSDSKPDSKSTSHKTTSHKTTSHKTTSHKTTSSKPATRKPDKKPAAEESSGGKCLDEVGCLLADNPPACCKKYGGGGGSKSSSKSSSGAKKPASDLPERLKDRGDIKDGINKVRGRVSACGDKFPGKGQVKVKISVSPSGSVGSVSVQSAPNSGLGNCVAGAVKKASFVKTQKGGSFVYPFVFR